MNAHAPALDADAAVVEGRLMMRRWASEFRSSGEIRFCNARIAGDADFSGALMNSGTGRAALVLDRCRLEGSLQLAECESTGDVRLVSARIGGDVDCTDSQLFGLTDVALDGDGADIGGRILLQPRRSRFRCRGGIRFERATVGGILKAQNAQLENAGGQALNLNGASLGEAACGCPTGLRARDAFPYRGSPRLARHSRAGLDPPRVVSSPARMRRAVRRRGRARC